MLIQIKSYKISHTFDHKLDSLFTKLDPDFFKGFSGIVLSCSGGTDSTALFHLLRRQFKFDQHFSLSLVHFNYGLRGEESDNDQIFVENLAKEHKIHLFVHKVKESGEEARPQKNIQAWARSIRMKILSNLAKEGKIIALAHQKDDLAENILLRMARGVSPGSLLGMSPWSHPFWRPLLNVGREDILEWLNHYKLPYRHDSSNDKLVYSRNVVRHVVLKELKGINSKARDHIVRCAMETQDFVEFTRKSVLMKENSEIPMVLDKKSLVSLPTSIAYDALSCYIGRPSENGINHHMLSNALNQLKKSDSKKKQCLAQLPRGKHLIQENGKISQIKSLSKKEKPRQKQHAAALTSRKNMLILGPSAIVDFFPVRTHSVLDQNFRICNSDSVSTKLSEF